MSGFPPVVTGFNLSYRIESGDYFPTSVGVEAAPGPPHCSQCGSPAALKYGAQTVLIRKAGAAICRECAFKFPGELMIEHYPTKEGFMMVGQKFWLVENLEKATYVRQSPTERLAHSGSFGLGPCALNAFLSHDAAVETMKPGDLLYVVTVDKVFKCSNVVVEEEK